MKVVQEKHTGAPEAGPAQRASELRPCESRGPAGSEPSASLPPRGGGGGQLLIRQPDVTVTVLISEPPLDADENSQVTFICNEISREDRERGGRASPSACPRPQAGARSSFFLETGAGRSDAPPRSTSGYQRTQRRGVNLPNSKAWKKAHSFLKPLFF